MRCNPPPRREGGADHLALHAAHLGPVHRSEVRVNVVGVLRDLVENKDLTPVAERLITPSGGCADQSG